MTIENILRAKRKPKEKQVRLVEAVCSKEISVEEFKTFFEEASNVDKGTCADALKHISEQRPELLGRHIDFIIRFINHKAPRVRWGISETIGNLAKQYPEKAAEAILSLLRNTVENEENTTVIRWCAAYALSEIVKYNREARQGLLPKIRGIAEKESNHGVKGVYLRAFRAIEKEHEGRV